MTRLRVVAVTVVMIIAILLDALSVSEDGIFLAILYFAWDIPALIGYFERKREGIDSLLLFRSNRALPLAITIVSSIALGIARHVLLLVSGKSIYGWFGLKIQSGLGDAFFAGLMAILLPVIYEEVSRYGVFLFINRRLGEKFAIIISSALFSILHIKSFTDGPSMYSLATFSAISICIRFVAGLIFINLSRKYGLFYAILSHFIVNSVIIIPVYILNSSKEQIYFNVAMASLFSAVALITAFCGDHFLSGRYKEKQHAHDHFPS